MKINNIPSKKPVGLYIHIPFCVQKCNYCDFLSMSANEELMDAYMKALGMELAKYQALAKEYEIHTIYIGGGTPSSIPAHYIENILAEIDTNFLIKVDNLAGLPEITLEANPGTLDKEKLIIYKRTGINRLSIGLQSIYDDKLKTLGRIHTFEQFLDNYSVAREVGFANVNIDLMSALPGQTLKEWERTLDNVIELKPEHISAYSLIIEEDTPFYQLYGHEQGEKLLPSEDVDRAMYAITKEMLSRAGYMRYEISNYSLPGYESKHNSSYWIGTEYLGIGLGASSLIKNIRYQNETNIETYISSMKDNGSIHQNTETLSIKNQMEEFMFLGLRMTRGISKQDFNNRFSIDIEKVYGSVIKKLQDQKLLTEKDDMIYLTEKGIDVSNGVFIEFLID